MPMNLKLEEQGIPVSEFNFVSQMAHWSGGALAVLAGCFFVGPVAMWPVSVVVVILAAVKEFWYDYKYETTEVRGSSLEDFLFYCLGVAIAIGFIYLRRLVFGV